MVENKIHSPLTEADLLSIVESTEDELLKAAAVLEATSNAILDGVFEAGLFAQLLKEKKLSSSTIAVQGERAFVLIHGFNAAGWLVIEGAGAYMLYQMYQAYQAGVTGLQNLLMAPFTALQNAFNSAASSVSSTASLIVNTPANVAAGNNAAAQITTANDQAYAPGGTIYNQIAATQGQSAADAAWATVQSHQAVQADQDVNDNPLTWL